ncbi:MAG: hypothetical protein RXP30_01420 [Thermoplasmata archaeon]
MILEIIRCKKCNGFSDCFSDPSELYLSAIDSSTEYKKWKCEFGGDV